MRALRSIRYSPFAIRLEIVIQLHYAAFQRGEFVMAAKALVQTRIDADVKEQATVVLENMGLTISDAVRILLTRTAKEGALPMELLTNSEVHDAWFRAKVREALADKRPDVDDAAVEAEFAERRALALRKARSRP
jgi:DNA-damage-inducible protein J